MSKKIRRNILPKPDEKLTKRQLIEILIVCMTVGILLLIYDYRDARINFNGVIKRNDAGFGNITQDLELEFLGETKDYTVEVSERGLSDEEVEAKFKQAVTEIENTYLGKNKSANKVMYDLLLNSNYADGLIDAFWRFDKYGYISSDGKLNEECITDAGEVINITAELSYEENTQLYSFSSPSKRGRNPLSKMEKENELSWLAHYYPGNCSCMCGICGTV